MKDFFTNGVFFTLEILLTVILIPAVIRLSRRAKSNRLRKTIYSSSNNVFDALKDASETFVGEILTRTNPKGDFGWLSPFAQGVVKDFGMVGITGALLALGKASLAGDRKAREKAEAELKRFREEIKVLSLSVTSEARDAVNQFNGRIEYFSPHIDDARMMLYAGDLSDRSAKLFARMERVLAHIDHSVEFSPENESKEIEDAYAALVEVARKHRCESRHARRQLSEPKDLFED